MTCNRNLRIRPLKSSKPKIVKLVGKLTEEQGVEGAEEGLRHEGLQLLASRVVGSTDPEAMRTKAAKVEMTLDHEQWLRYIPRGGQVHSARVITLRATRWPGFGPVFSVFLSLDCLLLAF